jgi:hypothetical protein
VAGEIEHYCAATGNNGELVQLLKKKRKEMFLELDLLKK